MCVCVPTPHRAVHTGRFSRPPRVADASWNMWCAPVSSFTTRPSPIHVRLQFQRMLTLNLFFKVSPPTLWTHFFILTEQFEALLVPHPRGGETLMKRVTCRITLLTIGRALHSTPDTHSVRNDVHRHFRARCGSLQIYLCINVFF